MTADRRRLDDIRERAARALGACREAEARSGRPEGSVTVVAACKTQPREIALAAVDGGIAHLGENRVQEAVQKWRRPEGAGAPAGVTLHMIGRLQRNKVRPALELFDVIHSCDSLALARRLAAVAGGRSVPALIEVNVAGEASKAGFSPSELRGAMAELAAIQGLELLGLMTIAPQGDPGGGCGAYGALRHLGEELRTHYPTLGAELSMGMTDDYPAAIAEGATIVRIGRAIYGERPA